jgi:ATP:ADP antiporter, AAA family
MLRALSDMRPRERRFAVAAFLTLFGIFAGYATLETARDALFLAKLPASQLPWVYLAMAGVAVLLTSAPNWLSSASPRPRTLATTLLFFAAGTLAFWAFATWHNNWMLRALYVWTGLVGTVAGLQFWLVLGEIYTITEAKRLYRLIGTGSLVGGAAGAGLARVVSAHIDASHLLVAAAALLAATACCAAFLLNAPRGQRATRDSTPRLTLARALEVLEREPYVKRLALLVVASNVTLTLVDYVFKSQVARYVASADLGAFFATFYLLLNLLALIAQVWLINWLLRIVGLQQALWVFPALVLLGASGVALGGGVVAALLLKSSDGTLRPSLHRTTTELLFLPLPDSLRARVKPLIDVVGQRGGQAIASVFILGELMIHRNDAVYAGAAAALAVVWIAAAVELRPHYVELFRKALREGTIQTTGDLPELDLGSLETLFTALNSSDDREVIAALDLLAEEGRVRLIPALVLYHPSESVTLRALELFESSGRSDFAPIADRLFSSASARVRAAALRARSRTLPEPELLRRALKDPGPLVRATGAIGLMAAGWISDEASSTLDALMRDGSGEARRAVAFAVARQPTPAAEPLLLELAYNPEPEVQGAVAEALGVLRTAEGLPALLPMLRSSATRRVARDAFLAYGAAGVAFLSAALADVSLPQELRRQIPRSLASFPAPEAAAALAARLLDEQDGMVRFKILRALNRIVARFPDVPLDTEVLRVGTEQTVGVAFRLEHWRRVLESGRAADAKRATRGHELLAKLLRDKRIHAVERLFRLLGLQHPREDFGGIYHGTRNRSPKARATSRELIENLVKPPLRTAVLDLTDEALENRALESIPFYEASSSLDYEGLLSLLLGTPGETVRCLAAYHVGELGLVSLRARIEAIRSRETGLFAARILERTLRQLDAIPARRGVSHAH